MRAVVIAGALFSVLLFIVSGALARATDSTVAHVSNDHPGVNRPVAHRSR